MPKQAVKVLTMLKHRILFEIAFTNEHSQNASTVIAATRTGWPAEAHFHLDDLSALLIE